MKELTLSDLMAIDYWLDQGKTLKEIAKMLFITEAQIKGSFISNNLKWAAWEVQIKMECYGQM